MAQMEDRMRRALTALEPTHLEVINESHKHAGHAGDDGTGESHWHVVIRAPVFEGQSRIAKHRTVHAALGIEIMGTIHALSLDISV